jgi:hypothetical protein
MRWLSGLVCAALGIHACSSGGSGGGFLDGGAGAGGIAGNGGGTVGEAGPAPTVCRKICCSASDCGSGQQCTAVYPSLGTAGLCSGNSGRGQNVGGTGMDGGLPSTCWRGAMTCNPLTNEGCAPGDACVLGDGDPDPMFDCFPAEDNAGPGEPCDNFEGPFCAAGYLCAP